VITSYQFYDCCSSEIPPVAITFNILGSTLLITSRVYLIDGRCYEVAPFPPGPFLPGFPVKTVSPFSYADCLECTTTNPCPTPTPTPTETETPTPTPTETETPTPTPTETETPTPTPTETETPTPTPTETETPTPTPTVTPTLGGRSFLAQENYFTIQQEDGSNIIVT
jgi:hypothetical protein